MRRRVFIQAVHNVVNNLVSSGMADMLNKVIDHYRGTKDDETKEYFVYSVFLKYAMEESTFGEAERSILRIMDLDSLSDPDWWQEIKKLPPRDYFEIYERVTFTVKNLPYLSKLLKQDFIDESSSTNMHATASSELRGMSLLNVMLVEDHGEFSSPARLIFVLEAITHLYEVIAELDDLPSSDLAVLAIDSGSDKSFDFLGLAKVMDSLKDLILGIWDRRLFHKNLQVSACMDTIANSLPIIEKIQELKASGALGPEQAELLKRKVIDGATKFLEVGAVTPEMGNQGGVSPRALMRPEQKLLAGPESSSNANAETSRTRAPSEGDGPLTEDEIRYMEELLKRAKGDS